MTYTIHDCLADTDDRDDSNDPEFRDPEGYCPHGTYVGGCGIDWICGPCEDGVSAEEAREIDRARRTAKTREQGERIQSFLTNVLSHYGVSGIDVQEIAESLYYVANPRARYGRH